MKANYRSIFLALLFCLISSKAFALAGIAERSSYFHYNDYAQVERGHPSDTCTGKTKWCLGLSKKNLRGLRGINSSFEELSVPPDSASPYFIGRLSENDHWLVYDLQQESIILEHPNYKNALDTWRSLKQKDPIFVNVKNTRDLLFETEESIDRRWKMDLFLWFFFGVLPLSIFAIMFWLASRRSARKYQAGGPIAYRILSYLFLIPVFGYLYLTSSSLWRIIENNW